MGEQYVIEFISDSIDKKQGIGFGGSGDYSYGSFVNGTYYESSHFTFRTYYDNEATVPIPGAALLLGSGLLGLIGIVRRKTTR